MTVLRNKNKSGQDIVYGWGKWSSKDSRDPLPDFSNDFWIKLKPVKRKVENLKEELLLYAEKFREILKKRYIFVLMSGGLDGEIIARTFLELKIPFTAFICEFTDFSNKHDIDYAKRFCDKFNVDKYIYRMNSAEFYEEIVKTQRKGVIFNILVVHQVYEIASYIIKSLNGYCISTLGSSVSSSTIISHNKGDHFFHFLSDSYKLRTLLRGFYDHFTSSELLLANIGDEIALKNYKKITNNEEAIELRNKIYSHYYPDLEKRPKYHGWEHEKRIQFIFRKRVRDVYPLLYPEHRFQEFKLGYERALELLGRKTIKDGDN
ncbi:hypothetical protein HYW58_02110 [Candidatus Kaiserbacteria bacterium]|nr:hypothetical protein [Candidatus Kaiserbacteria bacterium]